MKKYLFFIVLFVLLLGCAPSRWDHVDIEQVNAVGEVVAIWKDVKILATGPGILQGGDSWVRFETKDGKQISLMVPHRFNYR